MKRIRIAVFLLNALLMMSCSSVMTNTEFYDPVIDYLRSGDYGSAVEYIETAEKEGEYADKDRVLLFLDKGVVYHYAGMYEKSNQAFHQAEYLIDSLYTKSISKGAASLLLNDNALDYSGEVYEDLYINIFKALNYLHLGKFDDAYVEVHKISDKLKEFNVYFKEAVAEIQKYDENKIEFDAEEIDFYNDAFADYISHLIYREEGEDDNSRISIEKAKDAWENYPEVYNYEMPTPLKETETERITTLNIIAFSGNAPIKVPVGARITTFDGWIMISDPTDFHVTPIPFPGIKNGWNFKFEFPDLQEVGTVVENIEVYINGNHAGNLELLENISNVADKTFQTRKSMIFFKTAMRAIAKGISAGMAGEEIKKNTKDKALGDVLAFLFNAAVDMTEHADLRTWRTIPGYSFTAEIPIDEGTYDIEIRFVGLKEQTLKTVKYKNFPIKSGLNVLEAFYLD